MLAAVFAYEVDAAGADTFEAAYAPRGEWARFFAGADGYHGTELWCAAGEPLRYLVIDRWSSEGAYAAFLGAHADEYARRNRAAAGLWRRETVIGRFEAA